VKQYFNIKETKYRNFPATVIPIIFGKDYTVHPDSMTWLLKFGLTEASKGMGSLNDWLQHGAAGS